MNLIRGKRREGPRLARLLKKNLVSTMGINRAKTKQFPVGDLL